MRARPRQSLAAIGLTALLAGGATPAVSSAVADASADEPQIVQLGDSYSSGNGAGEYTDTTCYRSPLNYGQRVATALEGEYTNVACSGGVVADLTSPRTVDGETLPAQVEAVTAETDLVFLTIGGNDIGFTDIVTQCMVLRSPTGCEDRIDTATSRLKTLEDDALAALLEVDRRSGGTAQVYLLAYPYLMNTDSYGIPEGAPTYDAGAALTELQDEGDATQQAIIDAANAQTGSDRFVFVDGVKPAWGGYAHGLDPRAVPDNSDAWLVPVLAPGRVQSEWVHPTVEGWQASADALLAAVQATAPVEPEEPTDPEEPTEPEEPTDPGEPADPAQPETPSTTPDDGSDAGSDSGSGEAAAPGTDEPVRPAIVQTG